jgi:hypothetical protein
MVKSQNPVNPVKIERKLFGRLRNNFCSEGALEISQLRSGWKIAKKPFRPEGMMENQNNFPLSFQDKNSSRILPATS